MPAPKSPNFPGQLEGYVSHVGPQGFVTPPFRNLQLKGYEYLEELEQDTHLRGQLQLRFRAAVNPGYQIDPASNFADDLKIANFVRDSFDNLDGTFINGLQKIWDAVAKGFSLTEPVYKLANSGKFAGLYQLHDLRHIPAKFVRFDFDTAGQVKPDGVVLYTNPATRWNEKDVKTGQRFRYADFIHAVHGATNNPYGDPTTLRAAYWVWIKREVGKFWAYYAETFGAPVALIKMGQTSQAKTDSGSDEAKARQILADLRAFSGAALPRGFDVSFLEATRSGDPTYPALMDFCNREISKIVVGATLATEAGGKGSGASYALGKQHGSVAENFAYTDALWLEYVVNSKIIRPLVDLNFRTNDYPRFRLLEDNFARMIGAAQSLSLLQGMGVEIDPAWLHEWLGVPQAAPGQALQPAAPKPQPAKLPGLDNNLRRFADDPISNLRQPESRTRKIDELASASLFQFLRDLVANYVQHAQKLSPDGDRPAEPIPVPTINFGPFKRALMASGLLYYLTGKAQAAAEVRQAGHELPNGDPNPKLPQAFKPKSRLEEPFQLAAAVKAFQSILPLSQAELNQLSGLLETRFFQIAGLVRADMEKVWANQVLALRDQWSLREFEAAIRREVIRYAGDVYGLQTTGLPLLDRHLELIYRNGMNVGYAEGIDSLAQDPVITEFLAGYTYFAVGDDRTRPSHFELDGLTLPTDHDFWNFRTPPWDHNCRCTRRMVFHDEIQSGSASFTPDALLPDFNSPPASGFIR